MNLSDFEKKRWHWFLFFVITTGFVFLVIGVELSTFKKHDFTDKCYLCHAGDIEEDTPYQKIVLVDDIDKVCANCHSIKQRTSHPINVKPKTVIPLQKYLDKQGKLTCITCHDVHKEDKNSFTKQELEGLLRGHAKGRSFCSVCHNEEQLGVNWRHNLVVTYAHLSGELVQKEQVPFLDKFSIECLSCHDGTISKMSQVRVRGGSFKHGIGLSHPIGVEYPRRSPRNDFMPLSTLSGEITLFSGKLGCLSCHNPYGKRKNLLVMDNIRSQLCLSCHIK